jgi:hypothetical protein
VVSLLATRKPLRRRASESHDDFTFRKEISSPEVTDLSGASIEIT